MISKEDCFNSTPLPVEFMRSMQVISPIISWWLMEISTETNSNSNLFVGFFFIFSYYFIYSAPIWYLWLHLLLQMSRRFISIFGRLLEVRIIYIFIITILKPLFKTGIFVKYLLDDATRTCVGKIFNIIPGKW